jgi:uncharacterized membrane protein YcaP (DUF421 family)
MKAEDIQIEDIGRILMGEVPAEFLIEAVIRIVFLFLLLLFAMRLMGRRMSATLNRNELAALVALAAAIGVPMQEPARGLLPAVIIAIVVILIQRGIAILASRNKRFEMISQDKFDVLVEDGELNLDCMKKTGLSQDRVFAELRSFGIDNLGQVERLYIESSGMLNVLRYDKPKQGKSIIPEWDNDFYEEA